MIQAVSPSYSTAYPPLRAVSFGCGTREMARFGQDTHTGYKGHTDTPPPAHMNLFQKFGEWAIRQYQKGPVGRFIHDKIYKTIGLKCLYAETGSTSCSQYTLDKIRMEGFFKGCLKGLGRILNCNPFSQKSEKMSQWFRDDAPGEAPSSGKRYTPSFMTQASAN